MVVEREENRVEVVLLGLARNEMRRRALSECRSALGDQGVELHGEAFRPRLVSISGRVRLWEGSFEGVRE